MSNVIEEVADGLAKRASEYMNRSGDDMVEKRMADELGAVSPTLQEAFLTALRMRKAEFRGHSLLDKFEAGEHIPKAAISAAPQD